MVLKIAVNFMLKSSSKVYIGQNPKVRDFDSFSHYKDLNSYAKSIAFSYVVSSIISNNLSSYETEFHLMNFN